MGFLLLVSLVGFIVATTEARPGESSTGLFYHRLTLFTHGNEVTFRQDLMANESDAATLCASVGGKSIHRLQSQLELDDMIRELNAMELYGNTMHPRHNNGQRRCWVQGRLHSHGQWIDGRLYRFSDINYYDIHNAALFWRDAHTGYLLTAQYRDWWFTNYPLARRHWALCVRTKFFREIYREKYDVISPRNPFINSVNGRFNHQKSIEKCAHYGKQLVTVNSTQDVLDLQEEINRQGLIVGDNSRNFWIGNKVSGNVGDPVDPDNMVPGDKCVAIGQKYSSHALSRMGLFIAPCTRQKLNGVDDDRSAFIALCTDDEPGRYHGKLSLHGRSNVPGGHNICASLGKVMPDVNSDEDIMDFGRELKRIQPDTMRLSTGGYLTSTTTNHEGAGYWADMTPGTNFCITVTNHNANNIAAETWQAAGVDCLTERSIACMTP